jgi:hypothetical protein
MGVDRDGRQSWYRPDVAQVGSEARLVDRQIIVEREQYRRNNALRHEIGMAAHVPSPSVLLPAMTPLEHPKHPVPCLGQD